MQHGNGKNTAQHNASGGTGHQYNGQGHQIISGSGTINNYNASQPSFDKTREEIIQALNTAPYKQRKDRNPDRVPGTCEWFTGHADFHHWRDSKTSSMLWVSANPGCGKSVLAKSLVDELETTELRTTCYFFFKDDFEDQRSAKGALSCILHQLFIQRETLFSAEIVKRFRSYKPPLANSYYELWELWDILTMAAQERDAGEIICILDAFDECTNQERQDLGKIVREFYTSNDDTKKSVNLKFLITSRPYDAIRRDLIEPFNLQEFPVIHLKGDGDVEVEMIAGEISLYIKDKVSRLRAALNLTPKEEEILLQGLGTIHNQTYLWVYLTLEWIETEIRNKINEAEIRNVISTLPRTVDEAYDKILAKSTDVKKTRKLLHIVVAAERPLTIAEMDLALRIRQRHKSYKGLNQRPSDRVIKYIRDLCGLFINIKDEKIYLLHQTAKEFLVPRKNREKQKGIPAKRVGGSQTGQLTWKYSLIPSKSHRILFRICIWHLLFTELETSPLTGLDKITDYLRDNLFLEYSAKNWVAHFRASDIEENEVIEQLQRICDSTSTRCLTWFRIYWAGMHTDAEFPLNFTTIMIASYFGLESIVRVQLQLPDIEIDAIDSIHQRSALSWASENGFEGIVKLLIKGPKFHLKTALKKGFLLSLSQGAKVDAKDKIKRTPLSYASWNGHLSVVQRLVKAGARADLEDEIGGTPISYALCTGQQDVAKELMKRAQTDSVDEIRRKLLLSAVKNGHEPIVKRLVNSGANIEAVDERKRTPLALAAQSGHEPIVKCLLNSGSNIEAVDWDERTPLFIAALNGYEPVVKRLLNSGANIEAADNYKRTPLAFAAENGHEPIVKRLLDSGANIEAADKYKRTPLALAALGGHEQIVKRLLDIGANIEAADEDKTTPLAFAAWSGCEDVVERLLNSGANIEAVDGSIMTPLALAAQSGHEPIVKRLLHSGANIEAVDWHERTPLAIAAQNGHEAIVKRLLDSGANIEAVDREKMTPLAIAARRGNIALVQLLLNNGADINASKRDGNVTPLSIAVREKNTSVIELLRREGARS